MKQIVRQIQSAWHYLISEPFSWLIDYFLRIDAFVHDFQQKNSVQRRQFFLRLTIPMFLVSYLLALLFTLLFSLAHLSFDWLEIVCGTALGTLSGVLVGIA